MLDKQHNIKNKSVIFIYRPIYTLASVLRHIINVII